MPSGRSSGPSADLTLERRHLLPRWSVGARLNLVDKIRSRGCKPKPPKIPSAQIQPRQDCIQVNDLAGTAEGVVPVQMDVAPRCG